MLRKSTNRRSNKENLLLGASTAFASGTTNVASVIAFFAFTSNVTGHVAIFAEEIVKGHWHQVFIVLVWLLLFLLGAFIANFMISSVVKKGRYLSHAAPIFLEIIVLAVIAIYGHLYYQETLIETEYLVGGLLFAMGLQNSMVSTITGGVVKTTHVTGLFTDLGAELSQWVHPITPRSKVLQDRLKLRLVILSFYLIGGLAGGYIFLKFDFLVFFMVILVLIIVAYYDMTRIITKMTLRKIKKPAYVVQEQN
jgi:uncharacterized membrane protein YoaK (UPF0700 family)